MHPRSVESSIQARTQPRILAYAPNGKQLGQVTESGIEVRKYGGTSSLSDLLYAALLPRGFPASVPPDYLRYQIFDTLQGLCSYVRGQLTTQALLTAAGVGSGTATALGATTLFVARNLTGNIINLVFTGVYSGSFRSGAKKWRLLADIANSVSLHIELCAPLFTSRPAMILCAAVGSVFGSACGVAAGAARVSFAEHFARGCGDSADVATKEGTQETMASLVGIMLGWFVAYITDGKPRLLWVIFISLTLAHAFLNIAAVRSVQLRTIDVERLSLIVGVNLSDNTIPTPRDIAKCESLYPPLLWRNAAHWIAKKFGHLRVIVGGDLHWVAKRLGVETCCAQTKQFEDWLVCCVTNETGNGGSVVAIIQVGASEEKILEAAWCTCIAAHSIRKRMNAERAVLKGRKDVALRGGGEKLAQLLQSAGWDLSNGGLLGDEGYRAKWETRTV